MKNVAMKNSGLPKSSILGSPAKKGAAKLPKIGAKKSAVKSMMKGAKKK